MFTGIVDAQARLLSVQTGKRGLRIDLERPVEWAGLQTGESIAVDGVCLTLEESDEKRMVFFLGTETLGITKFESLLGAQSHRIPLNLERSLRFGDRLGGHILSGHVDGQGQIRVRRQEGECLHLSIEYAHQFSPYVIKKGSIAINGVSLTVNEQDTPQNTLSVLLIPETLRKTNLGAWSVSDAVNIEFDQMLKAVQRQVQFVLEQRGIYELNR